VSLVCWPILFGLEDSQVWIVLPFLILAAYTGAFKGVVFNRVFRNEAVTIIGGMCYSIYLLHYMLIPEMLPWTKGIGAGSSFDAYFAVQLLIYTPILMLLGGSYFVLVERPCMARDWPQRLRSAMIRLIRG
jgi:peptidoglycan/LPS O-acetylase OafA/YrhL